MSRYTVMRSNDCVVIEGAVPVTDFVALTQSWSTRVEDGEEWIVDALLAHHLGANFVIGPKSACELWRQQVGIASNGPPGDERESVEGNARAPGKKARKALPIHFECWMCGTQQVNDDGVMRCERCEHLTTPEQHLQALPMDGPCTCEICKARETFTKRQARPDL